MAKLCVCVWVTLLRVKEWCVCVCDNVVCVGDIVACERVVCVCVTMWRRTGRRGGRGGGADRSRVEKQERHTSFCFHKICPILAPHNDVGNHLPKTAHKHNCQFMWQAQYWVKFRTVWNVIVQGSAICCGVARVMLKPVFPKGLQDYLARFSHIGPSEECLLKVCPQEGLRREVNQSLPQESHDSFQRAFHSVSQQVNSVFNECLTRMSQNIVMTRVSYKRVQQDCMQKCLARLSQWPTMSRTRVSNKSAQEECLNESPRRVSE